MKILHTLRNEAKLSAELDRRRGDKRDLRREGWKKAALENTDEKLNRKA